MSHGLYVLDNLARELTRQNRLVLSILILASIILLLCIIFGAPIYYYRYARSDAKASISKNPNYGRSMMIDMFSTMCRFDSRIIYA
jgi:uncharacterized protein YneF (UPF0154 family)